MKITKRQLKRIIREAQWGRFTGGAAPLDEPPLDSGPMSPEMQQRVFDMLVDSGSDPKELKASGNYPDVESLDSDAARRYFQRTMEETKMKITRRQLRRIIKEGASRTLKEIANIDSGELRDIASTTVVNSDGQEQVLVFTGVTEHDDASGEFYYRLDNTEHEWELSSGYHDDGAASHIMEELGFDPYDDEVEALEGWRPLIDWLQSLKIESNYGNRSRW
jgi:hypothetical protein